VPGRKRDDLIAMDGGRRIRREDQAAIRHACNGLDSALNVGSGFDVTGQQFN
jgi:hypothetical protein